MNDSNTSLMDDDPEWGKAWPGSAMHYNATHPFPANSYLNSYELGERKDAFYVPTQTGPKTTIILALYIKKPQSIPTQRNNQEHIPGKGKNSTVEIVPRLFFPAKEGEKDIYGWGSRTKRDAAATWIEGNFKKVQSENLLTGCIAGNTAAGITKLLDGKIHGFIQSLGSVLRDTAFAPSCVGTPPPTFWTENGRQPISSLAAVTVDGIAYKLALREAVSTQKPLEWYDGQLYTKEKIDSVLVPLLGKEPAALKADRAKPFRKALDRIKSEGATYQYPESIKQCMFGDVVLWGPDEASTVASQSAAAS
jgi:hypothetical protein